MDKSGLSYVENRMKEYRAETFAKAKSQLKKEIENGEYFEAIMTLASLNSVIEQSYKQIPSEAVDMKEDLILTLTHIYRKMEESGETFMQNIFFKKLSEEYGFKWLDRMFINESGLVYIVKEVGPDNTIILEVVADRSNPGDAKPYLNVYTEKMLVELVDLHEYTEVDTANKTRFTPEVVEFDENLRGEELDKVYPYAKENDGRTIAKTRFTDELIRSASNEIAQETTRSEVQNEDVDAERKILNIQQRPKYISKIKLDILSKVAKEDVFKTKKGTILNISKKASEGENDKELFFSTPDLQIQFMKYVVILLQSNTNKTYDLSNDALEIINKNIADGAEPLNRTEWEYIKKCLGVVSQVYYDAIDDEIEEESVVEVENAMRDIVNNFEGKPRVNTMVMLNGHTGAGKGTTLAALGVERASETGTDGIAGRGEGFEHYIEVTQSYDLARFAGELMPNKFTRLMLATDIINQRRELDAQGKHDSPVYVSGFPRTEDQAKLFNGINNIKSIGLLITPETAVYRTVRRSIERTLKGLELRDDDMADMINIDDTPVSKTVLLELIKQFIDRHQITDPSVLTKEFLVDITSGLKLSKTARYMSYERARPSINKSLSSLGIETVNIQCDDLKMDEVTQMSREVILESPVEA